MKLLRAGGNVYREPFMDTMPGKHYWEIIADQLSAAGWSLGWIGYEARDFEGWKVDAQKDGQRHEVLAEDINTAFLELQGSIRGAARPTASR